MDTQRDSQGSYPCKHCRRSFRSATGIIRHLQVKKAEFPCDNCTTLFTTECAFLYHESVCHQKTQNIVQKVDKTKCNLKLPVSLRSPKEPKIGHEPKKLKAENTTPKMTFLLNNKDSTKSMAEKEEQLALILLDGNNEHKRLCPVCNDVVEDIQRHGRGHGTAFLIFCLKRRARIADKQRQV